MTDVSATRVTATGTVFASRTRVKKVCYAAGAGAGTLTFRDGGASGTVKLVLDSPANAGFYGDVEIPGDGILFSSDVHLTLSGAAAVTVIYG